MMMICFYIALCSGGVKDSHSHRKVHLVWLTTEPSVLKVMIVPNMPKEWTGGCHGGPSAEF